jgi:L-fuculose-phosphate aldolase
MELADLRFKIAAARRILFREGCNSQVAGQVSVRVPDADALLTTVFEEFDETLPDSVIRYSLGLDRDESGGGVVSPAVGFHAGIYRDRPDVNAVVHHHGHWTAVVCSLGEPVGMYNTLASSFYDDQALIFDSAEGLGFDAKRIPYALGDKNVLLMQNHGCVVVGPTLEIATAKAVLLERAAEFHVHCKMIGGTPLTDHDQLIEYKRLDEEYKLPAMWESRFNRLRRSDPDLFEWASVHTREKPT